MKAAVATIGDLLCLDFVNSKQKRRDRELDFISNFPQLLQFLLEPGILTPAIQSTLQNDWSLIKQNQAVSLAHSVRESLRKFLADLVQGVKLDSIPFDLNGILSFKNEYSSIVKSLSGFELKTHRDFTLPEHLLVPIAESAAWLICNADWKLVKTCSNPECGLFFYDITKNHRRRWCSMQTCGNRSKVDAYLKRKHGDSKSK